MIPLSKKKTQIATSLSKTKNAKKSKNVKFRSVKFRILFAHSPNGQSTKYFLIVKGKGLRPDFVALDNKKIFGARP